MAYVYSNQFKKSAIAGDLDLNTNPNATIMDVKYDPTDTSTNRLVPGEGVVLTDLGANDQAASGIPIIAKRTNNYDAVYGVKLFSTLKNNSEPGDNVKIAGKGAVVFMQCSGAISRGDKVALIVSTPGSVRTVTTGYTEFGVALDKGANADVIRVEITTVNEAVAAT